MKTDHPMSGESGGAAVLHVADLITSASIYSGLDTHYHQSGG